jgi:hypothetical protein
VRKDFFDSIGQTRTLLLGAARPLPPSADVDPGGQSVGQAAQFCLAPFPRAALERHLDQPPDCLGAAEVLLCSSVQCSTGLGTAAVVDTTSQPAASSMTNAGTLLRSLMATDYS